MLWLVACVQCQLRVVHVGSVLFYVRVFRSDLVCYHYCPAMVPLLLVQKNHNKRRMAETLLFPHVVFQ